MTATKTKAANGKVRRFAPKKELTPVEPVDFEMVFGRDGIEEIHEFTARPRLTYGDTVGITRYQDDGAAVLPYLDRLIRRALVDNDGTPSKWKVAPAGEGKIRGADGSAVPASEAASLAAFEAGSSRRRWIHLMERDEEVTVELEQVVELFEMLTSEAAGNRPT